MSARFDSAPPEWLTASDVAEFAYCPRALYYRRHPAENAPSSAATRAGRAGERRHERALHRVVELETHPWRSWIALAVGSLLTVAAVAIAIGWSS